jgi:hypothetical protein
VIGDERVVQSAMASTDDVRWVLIHYFSLMSLLFAGEASASKPFPLASPHGDMQHTSRKACSLVQMCSQKVKVAALFANDGFALRHCMLAACVGHNLCKRAAAALSCLGGAQDDRTGSILYKLLNASVLLTGSSDWAYGMILLSSLPAAG